MFIVSCCDIKYKKEVAFYRWLMLSLRGELIGTIIKIKLIPFKAQQKIRNDFQRMVNLPFPILSKVTVGWRWSCNTFANPPTYSYVCIHEAPDHMMYLIIFRLGSTAVGKQKLMQTTFFVAIQEEPLRVKHVTFNNGLHIEEE